MAEIMIYERLNDVRLLSMMNLIITEIRRILSFFHFHVLC